MSASGRTDSLKQLRVVVVDGTIEKSRRDTARRVAAEMEGGGVVTGG